jgi:hypothetical protein
MTGLLKLDIYDLAEAAGVGLKRRVKTNKLMKTNDARNDEA